MNELKLRLRLPLVVLAWLSFAVAGFCVWERYDATAGPVSPAAVSAHEASRLSLYLHPQCPCSQASLAEFGELVKAHGRPGRAVFVCPPDSDADFAQGELLTMAGRLPGIRVALDRDGVEARRVGAVTSGCVVATDDHGHVCFRGGLTLARGRGGRASAVLQLLAEPPGGLTTAPVFGCPLFNDLENSRCR